MGREKGRISCQHWVTFDLGYPTQDTSLRSLLPRPWHFPCCSTVPRFPLDNTTLWLRLWLVMLLCHMVSLFYTAAAGRFILSFEILPSVQTLSPTSAWSHQCSDGDLFLHPHPLASHKHCLLYLSELIVESFLHRRVQVFIFSLAKQTRPRGNRPKQSWNTFCSLSALLSLGADILDWDYLDSPALDWVCQNVFMNICFLNLWRPFVWTHSDPIYRA